MPCKLFIVVFSVFASLSASAQYQINENKVWVFGDNSGLDFNTTAPTPITTAITGGAGVSYEASAAVADESGHLLFYTNGENVWDRNHGLMLNAHRLYPPATPAWRSMVTSSSQGTVIAPMIDSPGKYYIFSITAWEQKQSTPEYDGLLFYSVVDMGLNGGLGDVDPTRKWIPVDEKMSELIIAVPGNSNNIWLITHANDTNAFRVWEVTSAGISASPVISYVGRWGERLHLASQIPPPNRYVNGWWSFGQMVISPDRTKLAVAYSRPNYAELYDFDPCTGMVSNAVLIDTVRQAGAVDYSTHSGIAFSPDGSKVYVSGLRQDFSTANNYFLYQFDVSTPTAGAIAASKTQVGPIHINAKLRLGSNGKIYGRGGVNQYTNPEVNVIHQPNLPVPACQYVVNDIILPNPAGIGNGNPFAKPMLLPADTSWRVALDTLVCELWDAGIVIGVPTASHDYIWEDGTSDSVRNITQPGRYWVGYRAGCQFHVDSFIIRGASLQPFTLGADTLLCDETPLTLSIPVPNVSYLWQDGQTTQDITVSQTGMYVATIAQDGCVISDTIEVRFAQGIDFGVGPFSYCNQEPISLSIPANAAPDASVLWSTGSVSPILTVTDTGSYWLTVTDGHCVASDSFRVVREICDCYPVVPTAFSPNGDGKNDIFRIVAHGDCIIAEYMLRIYNRWGALVYSGSDARQGWDGMVNGAPADQGTYMYHINMVGGTQHKSYEFKGDVMLLR